jgi:hypothetical protein
MRSDRILLPFRVILGLVPVCYSGLLIAVLPSTLLWAVIVALVLILLLVLFGWLDAPLQTIWPVFPGAILITAGTLALVVHAPTLGWTSTSQRGVFLLAFIGGGYIVWGLRASWKATHNY